MSGKRTCSSDEGVGVIECRTRCRGDGRERGRGERERGAEGRCSDVSAGGGALTGCDEERKGRSGGEKREGTSATVLVF